MYVAGYITQRVHVGIWYILRAQKGSHMTTLGPKYIPYEGKIPQKGVEQHPLDVANVRSLKCVLGYVYREGVYWLQLHADRSFYGLNEAVSHSLRNDTFQVSWQRVFFPKRAVPTRVAYAELLASVKAGQCSERLRVKCP